MSLKLQQAIIAEKVSVRNKTAVEVQIWYRTREGARATKIVGPFAIVELAPKLTDAIRLRASNLDSLVKRGAITIL